MSYGTERGRLNNQIVQLELELTQEQYAIDQIPFHKQMAIIGVAMNIATIVIFLLLTIVCFMGWGPFGMVVGPLAAIITAVAIIYLMKQGIGEIVKLYHNAYGQEAIERQKRMQELKNEIYELKKELQSIPVPTWNDNK